MCDLMESLPENCLFDKGRIGCGGTSLALECPEPYVVCVPFVSMIDNKVRQYSMGGRGKRSVLKVAEGVSVQQIQDYVQSQEVPKIMVTYDSLGKVSSAIDVSGLRLLVDEYHLLFQQYSFRRNAVRTVLAEYRKYKSFTFMTATPLDDDFILEELKGLPVVRQEWDDVADVKVSMVQCADVVSATASLVRKFLDGTEKGNGYFFVNSVDFICKMLDRVPELEEENCKIVYSKTNSKTLRLERGDLLSPPVKVTFLTSTVFEGSDIYDRDGRIIIVSDPSRSSTLVDISTSVQQICGRIRNSRYIGEMTHLYGKTRYNSISYDEFAVMMSDCEELSRRYAVQLNTLDDDVRARIPETMQVYVVVNDDGLYEYDANKKKIDLYNYKVVNGLYRCRAYLTDEYSRCGIQVEHSENEYVERAVRVRRSFKDIVEQYAKTGVLKPEDILRYPLLEEALRMLGVKGIRALGHSQKAVRLKMLRMSDKSLWYKVAKRMYAKLQVGKGYTGMQLKRALQSAYDELGIPDTAKGVDVSRYFITSVKAVRTAAGTRRMTVLLSRTYDTKQS